MNTDIILAEFVEEVKEESESLSEGLAKTFNFTEAKEVIAKILSSFSARVSALRRKPGNGRWQFCHNRVPFVLIRGKNISVKFFS